MGPLELSLQVKQLAARAGFDRCGIAVANPITRTDYVRTWLESGRAGTMGYLHRNLNKRLDARQLLPGARSVIVTASLYRANAPQECSTKENQPSGRVAMYAWGEDYHSVIRERLYELVASMRRELPERFDTRVCVDTAPLLEREYAAAAGIGWIAKNTLVLHQELGSFFFLGAIVTTLELAPDEPITNHCGSCSACLDACPTAAFPAPFEMDATRCISYLTIEHRGDIDETLAARMGDWMFGCDVCQSVCPFNRNAPGTNDQRLAPGAPGTNASPEEILGWSDDDYRLATENRATDRATLAMWKRNAAIASRNVTQRPAPPRPA